jgi:hypothetical protein
MTDYEIVQRTIDIIEERGITHTTLICKRGKVCVDGALALALGFSPDEIDADKSDIGPIYENRELNRMAERIADAIELPTSVSGLTDTARNAARLWRWNDQGHHGETETESKERIVDGLRKAAEVIRQHDS